MAPSTNNNSSILYPSESGSDVDRNSEFWDVPSFMPSSPALSNQSMVTNATSEMDPNGLENLVTFPSETTAYKFHENHTEWLIMTLYPKLVAVEEVWRRFEAMMAKLAEEKICHASMEICIRTGLLNIHAVMKEQHLQVVTSEDAGGKINWTLFLNEDSVFHGQAENDMDIMSGDFYVKRLAQLVRGVPRHVIDRL